jgi:hypothetical protein
MFIITTDGMENASHSYNIKQIKRMIENKKKKHNWEFLFIGANIDAISTAKSFGISENRAVNYKHDSKGTRLVYENIEKAVSQCRACAEISDSWKEDIDNDFRSRKSD